MDVKQYAEQTADKVNGLLSGADHFPDRCSAAGVAVTRRQARKYLRGDGRASRTYRVDEASPWQPMPKDWL